MAERHGTMTAAAAASANSILQQQAAIVGQAFFSDEALGSLWDLLDNVVVGFEADVQIEDRRRGLLQASTQWIYGGDEAAAHAAAAAPTTTTATTTTTTASRSATTTSLSQISSSSSSSSSSSRTAVDEETNFASKDLKATFAEQFEAISELRRADEQVMRRRKRMRIMELILINIAALSGKKTAALASEKKKVRGEAAPRPCRRHRHLSGQQGRR